MVKFATSLFNSFCRNVAKQFASFCCPFFLYFKLCLNCYVRFSCLLYQKNSLKHSRQTTHYLVLLICFNFLYQQRPVLMMRTATVNQKWLLILFRYGHHCKAYLYANLAKQVKPLKATVNQSFSLISHVLQGGSETSELVRTPPSM